MRAAIRPAKRASIRPPGLPFLQEVHRPCCTRHRAGRVGRRPANRQGKGSLPASSRPLSVRRRFMETLRQAGGCRNPVGLLAQMGVRENRGRFACDIQGRARRHQRSHGPSAIRHNSNQRHHPVRVVPRVKCLHCASRHHPTKPLRECLRDHVRVQRAASSHQPLQVLPSRRAA